ncbi:hypothetical protein [Bacillus sp. XF8]|uniref:DUF3784 domain-containing protein n=1 Tax=Bacillus bingmayongensis TaxID=1150157 RepID=A0ABU5K2B5_9BACI|nr:hypothetical protein [Bacillus sp. XF8]MBO1580447.1 hypothetical protein [Bacillus sp. XF8]MDZ5609901.1 hypothetical protein [Bacillus pseudomycoides]
MLAISLIFMALGIVIIFVGYSLRRKGKTSFIAGNNEVFVPKNEKKLAERIGLVIILFGLETVLFPIIFQVFNGIEGYHFTILVFLQILVVFILMLVDQMER